MSTGLAKLVDVAQKRWLPAVTPDQALWNHLGKAALVYANLAAGSVGIYYLRDALTAKRTGRLKFVDMVGLNGNKQDDPTAVNAFVQQKAHQGAKVWATGLGVGSVLASGAALANKRGLAVPAALKLFHEHLGLPNGDYRQLTKKVLFCFGLIPFMRACCSTAETKWRPRRP